MTHSIRLLLTGAIAILALAPLHAIVAQGTSPDAPLRLGDLLSAMEGTDRRAAQRPLLAEQSRLRSVTLQRELLPSLGGTATAQYVSDVPAFGGVSVVPHQQYDAYLTVRQRLFDPTRGPRRELEDAQLAESDARLRGAVWQQRQQVSDAFFTLLALESEAATVQAAIVELETQRRLAVTRRDAGAALPSEVALLDAAILLRRQQLDALAADRRATRSVLASLSGREIAEGATLELPDLAAAVEAARHTDATRQRPEYAQLDAVRDVAAARSRLLRRNDLPRLVAFGRLGYGRPGINPLAREFAQYWVTGVQLEWTPGLWGASGRDVQIQRLQQEQVALDAAHLDAQLARAIARDVAAVDRLARSLDSDDAIIALYETVYRETQRRFVEGGVTAAELVDRETDLLNARRSRDLHRVRLAESRARILITLGQEIR